MRLPILILLTFLVTVGCGSEARPPEGPSEATAPAPNTRQVNLSFNGVPMPDLADGLSAMSGKAVTVDPDANEYRLTLIDDEGVTMDQALDRILAKLRADGLKVRETRDTLSIEAGRFREVWLTRPPEDR